MNILSKITFFAGCLIVFSANADAALFYASSAFKVGYGTNSTTNLSTVPSTKMASYSAEGSLGFRVTLFLLGVSGEYSFRQQLTDSAQVSNINTQGTLKSISPTVGLDFGAIRIFGKFPSFITGDFTLEKFTASGSKVSYSDPSSLAIQLQWTPSRGYLILPYVNDTNSSKSRTFWGIEYQSLKFKKVRQGGTELALSDAQKLNIKTYSLLYGIFF